jgi:hypothetical protein
MYLILFAVLLFANNYKMLHTSHAENGPAGSGSGSEKTITLDNMNPNIKTMEYAVRGPLVISKFGLSSLSYYRSCHIRFHEFVLTVLGATEIEKELKSVRIARQFFIFTLCYPIY